jgi:hypothetical protein
MLLYRTDLEVPVDIDSVKDRDWMRSFFYYDTMLCLFIIKHHVTVQVLYLPVHKLTDESFLCRNFRHLFSGLHGVVVVLKIVLLESLPPFLHTFAQIINC